MGWCLTHFTTHPGAESAVRRAADALQRIATPVGWGFNSEAVPDADTTAWSVRCLRATGFRVEGAAACLESFIDPGGSSHTFRGAAAGTWSDAHADVTAMVGLALLAAHADWTLIGKVRSAVLRTRNADGVWDSFWWTTDTYATLWSVRFLELTGGISTDLRRHVARHLVVSPSATTPLEVSWRLLLALEVRCLSALELESYVVQLITMAGPTGWSAAPLLLTPARYEGDASAPGPYHDVRRLMTTAMCCLALARWHASQC